MPFTTYTLTGDVSDYVGVDYDLNKVLIILEASEPVTTDGLTLVRFGDVKAVIAGDGTFAITGIPATADNVPLYRAVFAWEDHGTEGRPTAATGWFAMTSDANLAAKVLDSLSPSGATVTSVAAMVKSKRGIAAAV